jgi:hypothetical protein
MIPLGGSRFATEEHHRFIEEVVAFVEASRLGHWEGQSSGAYAFDVSFQVRDVAAAATALALHLGAKYVGLRYRISDEYETLFDR